MKIVEMVPPASRFFLVRQHQMEILATKPGNTNSTGTGARVTQRNKAADNCPAPRKLDVIGHTLSHCRITAAIGADGMGAVYRATGMKLGREAALKLLPPDMARASSAKCASDRQCRHP